MSLALLAVNNVELHTWPKKPKMALITEYLPAAASADATADATCRINIS